MVSQEKVKTNEILHDSGASSCFFNSEQVHLVEDFQRHPQSVMCGNGLVEDMIQGTGVFWFLGLRMNCSVALNLAKSVVSVGAAAKHGVGSNFHTSGLTIKSDAVTIEYPLAIDNMYYLDPKWFTQSPGRLDSKGETTVMIADAIVKDKINLLHQRLGHTCNKRLIAMAKDELYQSRGIKLSESEIREIAGNFCIVCAMAKSTVKRREKPSKHVEPKMGEQYHVDIAGPNPTPSLHGYRYNYLIVEKISGKVWCYSSVRKDDATTLAILERFEVDHRGELHPVMTPKYFVSDNGEMASEKVRAYCRQKGYFNRYTPAYHSEYNGMVEIRIKMFKSISKCLLLQAKLPEPYWEFSDKYAVFLLGILPPCDGGGVNRDPDTLWYGRTFDYSRLRIWGSVAVANIPHPAKNRLPTGVKGIFVGMEGLEYIVYIPENDTFISSVDVTFYEKVDNQDDTVTKILESAAGRQHSDGVDPVPDQVLFQPEDFWQYVNKVHYDHVDHMHYVVAGVRTSRGSVVADRIACVDGSHQASDTIYAAHLLEYQIVTDEQVLSRLIDKCPALLQFLQRTKVAGGQVGETTQRSGSHMTYGDNHTTAGDNHVVPTSLVNLRRQATATVRATDLQEISGAKQGVEVDPNGTSPTNGLNLSSHGRVVARAKESVKRAQPGVSEDGFGNDKMTAGMPLRQVGRTESSLHSGLTLAAQNNQTPQQEALLPTDVPSGVKKCRNSKLKPSWRYVTTEDIEDEALSTPTPRDVRMAAKENSRSASVLTNLFMLFMTIGISASNVDIPKTHKKVLESPQREDWLAAENKEITSLWDVGAWVWEKLPQGRIPIRSKWTYDLKTDIEGIIQRFKARICARGDMTEEGIDYTETFSPVAKWESIRLFLAMTVLLGLIPMQLDVDLAYLYAPLTEAIYMIPPDGMNQPPGMILRLLQSLYGLPQSGRNWNAHLHENLMGAGFRRMDEDTCFYVRIILGVVTIVAVYVDDMYIAASNQETIDELVKFLQGTYKLKILGIPQQLLGVKISWGRNFSSVSISIPKMINQLVEKYNDQLSGKKIYVPISPGHNLSKTDCPSTEGLSKSEREGLSYMQKCYRNLVGSFIWICHTCRPDIMYVTMTLCMYMQNPGKRHWTVALQALDYLKATTKKGIRYHQSSNPVPYGYADSDFSAHESRRSIGSFIFMLAGGPFSWKSTMGKEIALSTCEAEIRAVHAAYHAIKEAIWLAKLFVELNIIKLGNQNCITIQVNEDNLAAVLWSRNPVYHSTMKHLERALYWIRQAVANKSVELTPIATLEQWADIGTKPFLRPRYEYLRDKFMVDCE